jgi:hypothetical protein
MRRSTHVLSHEHKLSMDMGQLVPLATVECLPGDTFIGSASMLARVAPLVNPVMHNVQLRVHHWYVPNRILWDGWEDFITGKDTVTEKPKHTIVGDHTDNGVLDHMGMWAYQSLTVDELPIRAYNMIWNEFYRDQDLHTERALNDTSIARICWEKDYFTVARPTQQQGAPIGIPLTGTADVSILGTNTNNSESFGVKYGDGTHRGMDSSGAIVGTRSGGGINPDYQMHVDLAQSNADINIDDLRRSLAFQRFAEARMAYGSRYVDYLRYLGVNPSDGRLDRPEYIGGGKQSINFSEVLAQAEGQNTQVGDMFGHGIVGLKSRRYRKQFEEHGWFISLLSARPKTVYMDGMPRKYKRFDHMDYWQKEMEVLPWQEVKEDEIFAQGTDQTFGYVPRYEEYRHEQSYVSGSFKNGPEIDWHMARVFQTAPTLNGSFVECTPTDRIYGDTAMPELLINGYNNIVAKRLVSRRASITKI